MENGEWGLGNGGFVDSVSRPPPGGERLEALSQLETHATARPCAAIPASSARRHAAPTEIRKAKQARTGLQSAQA